MDKRLLSYDPISGLYTYHSYDHENETTYISYGVEPKSTELILDINQKIANEPEFTKEGIKEGWWFYASIPVELQVKWLIEEGIDIWKKEDWPRVKAKINDRDFSKVKTTYGRHG